MIPWWYNQKILTVVYPIGHHAGFFNKYIERKKRKDGRGNCRLKKDIGIIPTNHNEGLDSGKQTVLNN